MLIQIQKITAEGEQVNVNIENAGALEALGEAKEAMTFLDERVRSMNARIVTMDKVEELLPAETRVIIHAIEDIRRGKPADEALRSITSALNHDKDRVQIEAEKLAKQMVRDDGR